MSFSMNKNLIAIGAGKGGVGKSMVTCCLALALKQLNFKVGICDLDFYGPSIGKMLPLETPVESKEGSLIPGESQGLKLLSIAHFKQGLGLNFVRAPIVNGFIKQFLNLVVWGDLDFLLFDCPPGTSDIHMTLMQEIQLSSALLVSTPQEVVILDVQKAAQMFKKMDVPILGCVENMSYMWNDQKKIYPFGLSHTGELLKDFNVKKLCEIPLEPSLSSICDRGIRWSDLDEGLKKIFLNLAQCVSLDSDYLHKIPNLSIKWDQNIGV